MSKRFECPLCEEIFSSAYEMAQHFQSEEHRTKGDVSNLDSLIDKFVGGMKTDQNKTDAEK